MPVFSPKDELKRKEGILERFAKYTLLSFRSSSRLPDGLLSFFLFILFSTGYFYPSKQ